MIPQEREMDMRKQALEEERRRREDLEKRLQEETSRRQKLIDREVKLREKQRAQVGKKNKHKRFVFHSKMFISDIFDRAFHLVSVANFCMFHAYFSLSVWFQSCLC